MGFLKYVVFLALVVLGTHAARLTPSALVEDEKDDDVSMPELTLDTPEGQAEESLSAADGEEEDEDVFFAEEADHSSVAEEEEEGEVEQQPSDGDEEEDGDAPMPDLVLDTSEEQAEDDDVSMPELTLNTPEGQAEDILSLQGPLVDADEESAFAAESVEEDVSVAVEEGQPVDSEEEEFPIEVVIDDPQALAAKFVKAVVALDFPGSFWAQDVDVMEKKPLEYRARDKEIHRELQEEARQILTSRGQTVPENAKDMYVQVVSILLRMGAFDKGRKLLDYMKDVCGDIWVAHSLLNDIPINWHGAKYGPMVMPSQIAARYHNIRFGWLKDVGTFEDVVRRGEDEWLLAGVLFEMVFDATIDEASKIRVGEVLAKLAQNSNMYKKKNKKEYYPALTKHTPEFVAMMTACKMAGIKRYKLNKWLRSMEKMMKAAKEMPDFPVGYRYKVRE